MNIEQYEGTMKEAFGKVIEEWANLLETVRLREENTLKNDQPSQDERDYEELPSGVMIAKNVSLRGLSWARTTYALQQSELRMPTIPEFFEYLRILHARSRQGDEDAKLRYDKLMNGKKSGLIGLWLDAIFREEDDGCYLNNFHTFIGENLVALGCERINKETISSPPDYMFAVWTTIYDMDDKGIPKRKAYAGRKQYMDKKGLDLLVLLGAVGVFQSKENFA